MSDYIERQAVIDAVHEEFDGCTVWDASGERTADEFESIIDRVPPADVVQVVRCKDCIHNNDCDIQYSAQAGDNFFCGFGETEKDVRKDVYE